MNIINPLSSKHHALDDLASHIKDQKGIKKLGSCLATAGIFLTSAFVGALTFGVGATPVFRLMVKQLVKSSDTNQIHNRVDNSRSAALTPTENRNARTTRQSNTPTRQANASRSLQYDRANAATAPNFTPE